VAIRRSGRILSSFLTGFSMTKGRLGVGVGGPVENKSSSLSLSPNNDVRFLLSAGGGLLTRSFFTTVDFSLVVLVREGIQFKRSSSSSSSSLNNDWGLLSLTFSFFDTLGAKISSSLSLASNKDLVGFEVPLGSVLVAEIILLVVLELIGGIDFKLEGKVLFVGFTLNKSSSSESELSSKRFFFFVGWITGSFDSSTFKIGSGVSWEEMRDFSPVGVSLNLAANSACRFDFKLG